MQPIRSQNSPTPNMRLTRWTDNHEVKSRGSCCGLLRDQPVHGAKIFNRNAGTYSCLPNQTVWTNVFARCGATKWQRWGQREEATTASLLQAGCNTGRYFHITPTKHNYGRNKFASITKQPELHNWAGGGGGGPHQHNKHALFPRYKLHCHTL